MSARLSPQREAEIAARAEAATPGPWRLSEDYNDIHSSEGDHLASYWHTADGAFIAHAPEGINALLAELAAVRAERDQLQRRFDELETLGRELLSHCTAEYGGPGYTHCELPTGHDGQHESALGHMRRATWGGEAR